MSRPSLVAIAVFVLVVQSQGSWLSLQWFNLGQETGADSDEDWTCDEDMRIHQEYRYTDCHWDLVHYRIYDCANNALYWTTYEDANCTIKTETDDGDIYGGRDLGCTENGLSDYDYHYYVSEIIALGENQDLKGTGKQYTTVTCDASPPVTATLTSYQDADCAIEVIGVQTLLGFGTHLGMDLDFECRSFRHGNLIQEREPYDLKGPHSTKRIIDGSNIVESVYSGVACNGTVEANFSYVGTGACTAYDMDDNYGSGRHTETGSQKWYRMVLTLPTTTTTTTTTTTSTTTGEAAEALATSTSTASAEASQASTSPAAEGSTAPGAGSTAPAAGSTSTGGSAGTTIAGEEAGGAPKVGITLVGTLSIYIMLGA